MNNERAKQFNELEKNLYIKEFYTLEQLSNELNMNIQTLRKIVKAGELKVSKIGNRYIVKRDDINKWLENNVLTKKQLKETQEKFKASYIESLKQVN